MLARRWVEVRANRFARVGGRAHLAALAASNTLYTYAPPTGMTDVSTETVQGSPTPDGGCAFASVTGTMGPDSPTVEGSEISVDPATCLQTFEVGTGSALAQDPAAMNGYDSTSAAAGDSSPSALLTASMASYAHQAHISTWYNDPLSIKLTNVRDYTNWNTSNGCVTSANNGYVDFWAIDEWMRLSKTWNHGAKCSYSWSTSYEKMGNATFCPLWTYTNYDPNRIHGLPSGRYWYSYNDSATGSCGWMLSFHYNIGTGDS